MPLRRGLVRCLLALSLIELAAGCAERVAPVGADTVFRDGYVYTVDAGRSVAEAVAIRDGKIVYVGTDAGVAAYIAAETTVVDLQGRMVLPGFQDVHVHPIEAGVEGALCDISSLGKLEEYKLAIVEYAAANPDLPWIIGGGWEVFDFGPGGSPDRHILDALVPDRPVYLASLDEHSGWANSLALEIAGIDKDTPDPPGGIIERDAETGEPTGVLLEDARDLVRKHMSPVTREDKIKGLKRSIDILNGWGITSMQDASVDGDEELEVYKALEQGGELHMRVVASMRWYGDRPADEQFETLLASREKYASQLLDAASVKIWQDGVIENYTAAMLEPYLIPGGSRGRALIDPEVLQRIVVQLDAAGFQLQFHAIGDAAVRQSLDAVEAAVKENGVLGHRHHIAHLEVVDPADIPRFKQLGVIANFQPLWAYADTYLTDLTIPFIGAERARWLYPIKSVLDTGATVAFGSDWSVSTANPLPQIETAITRQDAFEEQENAFIPEERIDLESAIAAFTINAAFANRREKETGSIEVGKYADLVVLDQNLFEIDATDISETQVLLTMFEGQVVHGDVAELR